MKSSIVHYDGQLDPPCSHVTGFPERVYEILLTRLLHGRERKKDWSHIFPKQPFSRFRIAQEPPTQCRRFQCDLQLSGLA